MSYPAEASHGRRASFKWRKGFGQTSEKPLRLLEFQTRAFHVKRFLVQENESRSTGISP